MIAILIIIGLLLCAVGLALREYIRERYEIRRNDPIVYRPPANKDQRP